MMKQTKFVINKCSESLSRLGLLELQTAAGNAGQQAVYETPMYFVHTEGGSIPHVTPDVFKVIFDGNGKKPPVQMSVDSLYSLRNTVGPSEMTISKFCGLPDSPCLLTIQNPLENVTSGFNGKKGISIWTRNGRQSITLDNFPDMVSRFCPTMYQCLHDYDVDSSTLQKRLQKSTSRSSSFCTDTLQRMQELGNTAGALVPLEPAWFYLNDKEGDKTLAEILEMRHEIQGFVVKRNYEEEMDFLELFKLISLKVPKDKVLYLSGVFNFEEIMDLTLEGADIFDSSLCTSLTNEMKAFVLPKFAWETWGKNVHQTDIEDTRDATSTDRTNARQKLQVLNFKEKRYLEDFSPIADDCSCYTCRKHSRSYIHHLHITNELLGYVLIMIHNLFNYDRFFKILRHCMESEGNAFTVFRKCVSSNDLKIHDGNFHITRRRADANSN